MTRPRQRNLGPVLALAGAGIAAVAVIVGFIVIGGPGDARDRRLDEMTLTRIYDIGAVVQCAFNATGLAPLDLEAAASTRTSNADRDRFGYPTCGGSTGKLPFEIASGDTPATAGNISYAATSPGQVKICGNFHAASGAEPVQMYRGFELRYPQLGDPHPKGVHCYVIDLVRTADPPPEFNPDSP